MISRCNQQYSTSLFDKADRNYSHSKSHLHGTCHHPWSLLQYTESNWPTLLHNCSLYILHNPQLCVHNILTDVSIVYNAGNVICAICSFVHFMYLYTCAYNIISVYMCRDTILAEWTYSWHIPYGSVVCLGPGDREKVLADSAHILSRYKTWKALNRWVPEHRSQQDCGIASCTLWAWIAIGNWCSCRHSFPPPGCRVVLYTLTLFIDDCTDYAFSLVCPQVCQLTWTVSCGRLCMADMDEVTWLWAIT